MIAKFKPYFKYFFYASSIIVSRGLEYFVLFYAALFLPKDAYGELEFYKKIIELLAVVLAFGLPSLLLTYTKSKNSKVYLNVLAHFFITFMALVVFPLLWIFNYQFLIIPILFHAIFFNNGVMPVFFITQLGSNKASIYKSATSFLFYTGVFLLLLFNPEPQKAFVVVNYYLIGIGSLFSIIIFRKYQIKRSLLKRYFKLFKNLLISSLTLVVSNFANVMFLYTDIMILKLISNTPNVDIANYSFALNIANMLILVPFTMVHVDIEKIKKESYDWLQGYRKKIVIYTSAFSIFIMLGYFILTNTFYEAYKDTIILFLILFVGKIIQSNSVFLGAQVLIKKYFIENLKINLITVTFNVIASYLCYLKFGLLGIAFVSALSLAIRYIVLKFYYKKIYR